MGKSASSGDMDRTGALIVTGAGRGIGAAIARAAARDGWPVVVNYGQSRDAAERVAAEIADAGGTATAIGADVADEAAVMRMFDDAETRLQWRFRSARAQGLVDDELFIAFA